MGDFFIDDIDSMPEAELLGEEADRRLDAIATELDAVLTDLDESANAAIRQLQIDRASIANDLAKPADASLSLLRELRGDVSADLFAPVDSGIDSLLTDAQSLRAGIALDANAVQSPPVVDDAETLCQQALHLLSIGTDSAVVQRYITSTAANLGLDRDTTLQLLSVCGGRELPPQDVPLPPEPPPPLDQPPADQGGIGGGAGGGGAPLPPDFDIIGRCAARSQFPRFLELQAAAGVPVQLPQRAPCGGNLSVDDFILQTLNLPWREWGRLVGLICPRDLIDVIRVACYLSYRCVDAPIVDQVLTNLLEMVGVPGFHVGGLVSNATVPPDQRRCDQPQPPQQPPGKPLQPPPDQPGDNGQAPGDCPPCPPADAEKPVAEPQPVAVNIEALGVGDCAEELPAGPVAENILQGIDVLKSIFTFSDQKPLEKMTDFFTGGGVLSLFGKLLNPLGGALDKIVEAYKRVAAENECDPNAAGVLVLTRVFFSIIDLLTGGAVREQIVALNQQIAAACPTGIPTPSEALSAYLAGEIDGDELACLVKANNQTWDWWKYVAESARQKWDVPTLVALRRRGRITPAQFQQLARRLGWLDNAEAETLWEISPQLPFQSDLIRMMQRDVVDDVNIDWTESDRTFAQKYKDQVKTWAEWQGIPEDVFKLNWRAHWRIPSPTQLFEWLFKTGRNPDGSFDQQKLQRVRFALQQDDVMPDWVDPLIDSQFSLPRITQIGKLAKSGIFNRQDIFDQFAKRGLETQTAEALTIDALREAKFAYVNHRYTKDYANGYINESQLRTELRRLGAGPDAIDEAVHTGKLEMRMETTKRCLENTRNAYLIGDIDPATAQREALNLTGDGNQSAELFEQWDCERKSRAKTVTASQLCGFYDSGFIDQGEFAQRLVDMGYSPTEADLMVGRCDWKKDRRISREQEAERRQREAALRRERAEARRIAREQERLAEEREREAEQEAEEREQEQDRAARARRQAQRKLEQRKERVARGAKTFCNRNDCDLSETTDRMWTWAVSLNRQGVATMEHLSHVIATAASRKSILTIGQWQDEARDLLVEDGADLPTANA